MNDIIVYHGWYYWKRGSSCVYSFQYYRQHYFLSLGGGRKPHLPKMWEPSCRKNPSKTEQRTVVVFEFIKRELATLKPWFFFFFSILHHSWKLMPTFWEPKIVLSLCSGYELKDSREKRRNAAKFNLFNIRIDLFKNFLTPELYLQCRETARYQENLPPASLSMLG